MSYKTIAKVFICLFAIHIIFIEGSEPVLFLALENNDGIISLDLNNGDITVIVDALSNPAIGYHTRLGLLYYTDSNTRTISRIRYPPNGNTASPEIIIQAVDDHRPINVAVDSFNNYIYWADDYAGSITKADLCGFNKRVILQDSSINKILGIALDAENSVIYFTDNGAGKIEKIDLDGSNRQILYSNADFPNLIYLDINEQKLYWTNSGSQNIQSMNSDGTSLKTVVYYSHYPYGLDGYNGYIYWSQSRNGIIKRAGKSGGSSKSWYYTRPYGVIGVKVYDGGNLLPAKHVCTTEGGITIFQTTNDDKLSIVAIALATVLLVFVIVVTGIMFCKVKSNNARIQNGNRERAKETTTRPRRMFRPKIDVNRDRLERNQYDDQRIERHDAQVRISRDRIRGDLQIYFLEN